MTSSSPQHPCPRRGRGARGFRLLLALACAVLTGPLAAADRGGLVLGVHPYLSYAELQERFQPLARYLGDGLGVTVSVRVGRDYQEHVDEVGRDLLDIAYVGPVSYLRIRGQFGSKPLLARLERNGRAVLDGHIVVRSDSDIGRLEDLPGRSLGLGDPDSTMSSVVPIAVLRQAGIPLERLSLHDRYQGHTNIALAVLSGQVDAGAVKAEVYERFKDRGLRSLRRLPEVPEHLFLARAGLPPALVDGIRQLLLDAHRSPAGLAALRALHPEATSLVPVEPADYDGLQQLLAPQAEP